MSVPIITSTHVAAPLPPVTPPLLPDVNAPHATSDASAYTDKQLRDLEMRKNFPGLWRLAKAQAAQMKEDLRKRAAASLAYEPQMVQQTRESADKREWIDCGLALHDSRAQGLARAAHGMQGTQGTQGSGWPPAGCGDRYFSEYKEVMESFAPLSYQLVGGGDPNATCITRLPEFIICSDEYLSSTFYDPFDWPKQILDYRNITELWEENPSKGSCAMWWKIECPQPATTQDEINQQIDDALRTEAGTRTYLNQTQLDDYLAWRKVNGSADGFRYIRVSDKQGAKAPAQQGPAAGPGPEAAKNPAGSNAAVISVFTMGIGLLTLAAGAGAIFLGKRKLPTTAPTVATTVPQGAQPVRGTASPSSVASASATVSHGANLTQPAPSAAQPQSATGAPSSTSSSDDASNIGTSTVVVDRLPAGQEDDA